MIYLLHGEDGFRRELKIAQLRKELVDPSWESTNLIELNNPSVVEFCDNAATCPFGFGERLVIINDAKFLTKKEEEETVSSILETLDNLPDRVTVIFNSKKILGTVKLVKAIKKISEIIECKEFAPWETKDSANWLIGLSKDLKKEGIDVQLNYETAEFMVEYLGTESSKLYSEIKRLATLKPQISIELIQKECKAKYDIFKFARSIAEGNRSIAQEELSKIIENDEAHIGLLSSLQTNIGKYLKSKLILQERKPEAEQAKQLGISPGRLYYLKKEIGSMDFSRLESLNSELTSIERRVKQGKSKVDLSLKLLINK